MVPGTVNLAFPQGYPRKTCPAAPASPRSPWGEAVGSPPAMADAPDGAPGMTRGGLRRIALAAFLAAVLSGTIAAVGALAADPRDRWGAAVVFVWTALPPVLGARACVLAQQRGWLAAWRRGAAAGALGLAAATL